MRRLIIHKEGSFNRRACPDFNGFNTERLHESGVSLKPKS